MVTCGKVSDLFRPDFSRHARPGNKEESRTVSALEVMQVDVVTRDKKCMLRSARRHGLLFGRQRCQDAGGDCFSQLLVALITEMDIARFLDFVYGWPGKFVQVVYCGATARHDALSGRVIDRHVSGSSRHRQPTVGDRCGSCPYQSRAGPRKPCDQPVEILFILLDRHLIQAIAHDLEVIQAEVEMNYIPATLSKPGINVGNSIRRGPAVLRNSVNVRFSVE